MSHFICSWNGNKRLDIQFFKPHYPPNNEYDIVVEPFCGTSAVAFDLNKQSHLNDIDPKLIKLYDLIREDNIEETFIKIFDYVNGLLKTNTIKEIVELFNNSDDKLNILAKLKYKRKLTFTKNISLKPPKITKKNIAFQKFIKEKTTVTNYDYIEIFNKYMNDPTAFIFIDPPYFDSSNTDYYSQKLENPTNTTIQTKDNTKMFIDIYHLLKNGKCKVMLIINDNYITRFIYNDFIKSSYMKKYLNNILINNKYLNKCSSHLIVTNY